MKTINVHSEDTPEARATIATSIEQRAQELTACAAELQGIADRLRAGEETAPDAGLKANVVLCYLALETNP